MAAYPSRADRRPITGIEELLEVRMDSNATELASDPPDPAEAKSQPPDQHAVCMDDKHLARITPALKSKYRLNPSRTSENSGAGVNMSLLAYAGPYKAIGQGIREPLQSAQTALKMTSEIAAEQVRVQRAAVASAQRKANARAAAEQSEQAGLAGRGARSKHQSSSSFKSMSRDQRQRPGSATASMGPGWYHVRHTAVEKQPHAARLKPRAPRPASAGAAKSPAGTPRSHLARQPSMKSGAKSASAAAAAAAAAAAMETDGAPLLGPPPHAKRGSKHDPAEHPPLAEGLPQAADSASFGRTLGRTTTGMSPDLLKQTLGRAATSMGPDFLQQTLARSPTAARTDLLRQTLGRADTNTLPDFLRQTLARTATNMGSDLLGKTLGRAATGMGSMAFGATMGRTLGGDFGMTQPAVLPLCIDPLVTAMLQRAGTDAPPSQPRSTSAAFASSPRTPRHAAPNPTQPAGVAREASPPAHVDDAAVRRHCTAPVPFGLQTNRPQSSPELQGKAHLAPGMHFKGLDTPGGHVKAGHSPSLQHLDFTRQTPRPSLAREEGSHGGQAPEVGPSAEHERSSRPATARDQACARRRKRPMSAWAEQPGGGSPAGARPRPASALPLQRPCGSQADDAGCAPEPEKLFWTAPKAWMLACMDKGMPLRKKKTHACAGAETNEDWKQWAAQQADMQSLDSFCFSTPTDRPVSAQSPYSPGKRIQARARPASAAAPATRPRTQQLWQGLTRPQQAKPRKQAEDSGKTTTARADSPAGQVHAPEARSNSCASPQQVVVVAAHHQSSAASGCPSKEAQPSLDQAGCKSGSPQPDTVAESAAEGGEATVSKRRPETAHVQVQSPGVFLRKARPQSAGAANVTQARAGKTAHLGVHAFNEPKRETGWVDFRAQNRMGARVHGGAISAVTRMEALHSMRPLSQTQGPFELTGNSPWEKYLTAKYNPHDEVRSHRTRSPAWALPPNRATPKWRGTVHRSGPSRSQQATFKNGWQQEWQEWVHVAASNLHQRSC